MSEDHGPQIVVWRKSRESEEHVLRTPEFAIAGQAWREHKREMEAGGYTIWINDGDLWRYSGLLDDRPRALAIRDRVVSDYSQPPLCEIEATQPLDELWIRLQVITANNGEEQVQEFRISQPAARRLCRALQKITDCTF